MFFAGNRRSSLLATSLVAAPCSILRCSHCLASCPDNEVFRAKSKSSSLGRGPRQVDTPNTHWPKAEFAGSIEPRGEFACSQDDHPPPTGRTRHAPVHFCAQVAKGAHPLPETGEYYDAPNKIQPEFHFAIRRPHPSECTSADRKWQRASCKRHPRPPGGSWGALGSEGKTRGKHPSRARRSRRRRTTGLLPIPH